MRERQREPDFLLIGAAKSGTTWLLETLRSADGVFVPRHEIHYFSRFYSESNWQWYLHHFVDAMAHELVGENSNTYLTDALAPGRIQSKLPNVKLVAVLRNPIERAYSAYCMQVARGKAAEDIRMYLDPRFARRPHILKYGKYHVQLTRYLDLFPNERIFVVLYDDVVRGAQHVLRRLGKFLDVPNPEGVKSFPGRVNARKSVSMHYPIRRLLGPMLGREAARRPLVKLVRSVPLWRAAESVLSGPVGYPPIPDDVRRRLAEYYADDVFKLSRLVQRDLSQWLRAASETNGGSCSQVSALKF